MAVKMVANILFISYNLAIYKLIWLKLNFNGWNKSKKVNTNPKWLSRWRPNSLIDCYCAIY